MSPPSPRPDGPPPLIGISGKQYAGKDVVADLLVEALPGYRKLPLALAIKQEYGREHGLELAQIEAEKYRHRPGLIALGDRRRAEDPDYWLKRVLNVPGPKIVSDVRLQREHALLRQWGGFLIRLEADRAVRADRGTLVRETDATECDLDDTRDWDALLVNNGTRDDLARQVAALLAGWGVVPLPEGSTGKAH